MSHKIKMRRLGVEIPPAPQTVNQNATRRGSTGSQLHAEAARPMLLPPLRYSSDRYKGACSLPYCQSIYYRASVKRGMLNLRGNPMNTHMTTIEVDVATAAILQTLKTKAEAQGVPLNTLLASLAPNASVLQQQRAADLVRWLKEHSIEGVIADDRRESIYI